jgi:hypothetical protein
MEGQLRTVVSEHGGGRSGHAAEGDPLFDHYYFPSTFFMEREG